MVRPLAPYASKPEETRGRLHPEPEHSMRSVFQRDRDRIIHSAAFRRLTHKTQVFVYHEGDHYRTRLTHSLEVAQIARTISRALGLDEDLAETLALAHDLGHTPFGHAGEEALNTEMARFGGFSHNDHTLRILTRLERRYAEFDGLNLTWETLEGVVKHNGPLRGAGIDRPVPPTIAEYDRCHPLALDQFPSAEAQVAALADDIAYNNHDIDDGLRAGLFGRPGLSFGRIALSRARRVAPDSRGDPPADRSNGRRFDYRDAVSSGGGRDRFGRSSQDARRPGRRVLGRDAAQRSGLEGFPA
jgi:dGTPase